MHAWSPCTDKRALCFPLLLKLDVLTIIKLRSFRWNVFKRFQCPSAYLGPNAYKPLGGKAATIHNGLFDSTAAKVKISCEIYRTVKNENRHTHKESKHFGQSRRAIYSVGVKSSSDWPWQMQKLGEQEFTRLWDLSSPRERRRG